VNAMKTKRRITRHKLLSYLVNLLGITVFYFLLMLLFESGVLGAYTTYIKGIATTACYTIILVCSLNLLVGTMGEFSLGHAGFMSVGAYSSYLVSSALVDKGIPPIILFVIVLIAGGLCSAVAGVLVGIPALRLRGDYLAIVTLAFAEIIRVAFTNFSFTGAGRAISGITKLSDFYWCYWAVVVCVAVMFMFVRSRFGRVVMAIREDYIAAASSGVHVTLYKVLTFAISAFFAGVGGAMYAHYMTSMIPTIFNFNYSAEFLTEVIIGGTGSLTGSIVGATFLSALPELTRSFSTYRMLAYSIVLLLVMLFKPGGIFGTWEFSLARLVFPWERSKPRPVSIAYSLGKHRLFGKEDTAHGSKK